MESDFSGAKQYFDKIPQQWDTLYSHENRAQYWLNRLLRNAIFKRYELTFQHCGDLQGARVLDIGCGSGRYSIECAKRGARQVVGVDIAPSMVEFSTNIAEKMGVADACRFVHGDFADCTFEEPFDIVIAVGFFDYVKSPEVILQKVAALKPRMFVASFPRFSLLWSPQRHIRYYWIRKCPIYYYSEQQLGELYQTAGFPKHEIIPCGKGYFGTAGFGEAVQS